MILGCALMLGCFQLLAQDTDSILNIRIERGDNLSAWSINLIVENIMQEDILFISSDFLIDEPRGPSRILIYRSWRDSSTDSLRFISGFSRNHHTQRPNRISFSDERLMKILPKEKLVLEVPISHLYIGSEIFLDIRMLAMVNIDVFRVEKRTNKILFQREHSEHERFQLEQIRRRQESMQNQQTEPVEEVKEEENKN